MLKFVTPKLLPQLSHEVEQYYRDAQLFSEGIGLHRERSISRFSVDGT